MAKKLEQRSKRSLEEFAKSLIVVANTIHGAIFVSVLVLPLTVSVHAIVSTGEAPITSIEQLFGMLDWLQIPLAVFLFLSVWFGIMLKNRAMDILDEMSGNES